MDRSPAMPHPRALAVVACLLAAAPLAGCGCLSPQDVGIRIERLQRENDAQAAVSMRTAAARMNARLLPLRPQTLLLPECGATEPLDYPLEWAAGCIHWRSSDGKALRFEDREGKMKLALIVAEDGIWYARLARRDRTYFVLNARVTRRAVDTGTRCTCDGGPNVVMGTPVHAFVLDDVPEFSLHEPYIPVTEDYIDWQCVVIAV